MDFANDIMGSHMARKNSEANGEGVVWGLVFRFVSSLFYLLMGWPGLDSPLG